MKKTLLCIALMLLATFLTSFIYAQYHETSVLHVSDCTNDWNDNSDTNDGNDEVCVNNDENHGNDEVCVNIDVNDKDDKICIDNDVNDNDVIGGNDVIDGNDVEIDKTCEGNYVNDNDVFDENDVFVELPLYVPVLEGAFVFPTGMQISRGRYIDSVVIVGVDIPPGTYRITSQREVLQFNLSGYFGAGNFRSAFVSCSFDSPWANSSVWIDLQYGDEITIFQSTGSREIGERSYAVFTPTTDERPEISAWLYYSFCGTIIRTNHPTFESFPDYVEFCAC